MLGQTSILAVASLVATVTAIPQVTLPFNSQVPAVARIAEQYEFELAPTTFAQGNDAHLRYTLVNAPAWLNLDSQSGTLYGVPGDGDSGPNTFSIRAADLTGTTDMACTVIVTDNTPPRIAGNLTAVIAKTGVLSGPASLSLQPDVAFTLEFGKDFFEQGSKPIQAYYATLSDHTPLPSWLAFEEASLGFLGVAPRLTGGPQSWNIKLVASDVVGFAGVSSAFTLAISAHQLSFQPQHEEVLVTPGIFFSFEALTDQLSLDNKAPGHSQIRSTYGLTPSWLTFDNDSFHLSGMPPKGLLSQTATVSVTDVFGDIAIKTILLRVKNSSLFAGEIQNMTATAGEPFTYSFDPSLFSQSDLNISVDLGAATSWLRYDTDMLQLQGTPPVNSRSQVMHLVMNAALSDPSTKDSRMFELHLQAAPLGVVPPFSHVSSTVASVSSPTGSSETTTTSASEEISKHAAKHRTVGSGVAVAIALGCLALLVGVIAGAMLVHRRKRRSEHRQPGQLSISKPKSMRPSDPPDVTRNVLKGNGILNDAENGMNVHDQPPRINLPIHHSSLGTPQAGYQPSMVSSIGDGQVALQADPNIPLWGTLAGVAHTPHHSYSAATELARQNSRSSRDRLSQFARQSPRTRSSRPLQSLRSEQSTGFRTSLHGSVVRPSQRRPRISSELSPSRRSSGGSFDTHGTSLLSARASDFPEPPTMHKRRSQMPALSIQDVNKRRSIRLVTRSDSISDERPLAEKRQSFIRNRASSSIISPLFASSRRSSNLREEVLNGGNSLRRNRSQLTNFSASSSAAPRLPPRSPHRLASNADLFTPSVKHSVSAFPSRLSSPSRDRDVIFEDSDTYPVSLRLNDTTTPCSEELFEAAQAAAEFAAQLNLPRHSRTWVVPGEASPTPPPSSVAREAGRRRWANKLKRDSKGRPVPREESPVRLTDVVQRLGRRGESDGGPEARLGKEESMSTSGANRLSLLVSKDSINGPMRKRARRDVEAGDMGVGERDSENIHPSGDVQTAAGASSNESEWEDVMSYSGSRVGSGLHIRPEQGDAPKSAFSGKAFI